MKRIIGLGGALGGFILLGLTIARVVNGTFASDLATSILYASFALLLFILGGYLLFQ